VIITTKLYGNAVLVLYSLEYSKWKVVASIQPDNITIGIAPKKPPYNNGPLLNPPYNSSEMFNHNPYQMKLLQ
jgi:hypothetical protein